MTEFFQLIILEANWAWESIASNLFTNTSQLEVPRLEAKLFDRFINILTIGSQKRCVRDIKLLSMSPHLQCNDSAWHGKDEQRADGPPALTDIIGKPEPVSFMFKTICDTGIIIAIDLQKRRKTNGKAGICSGW